MYSKILFFVFGLTLVLGCSKEDIDVPTYPITYQLSGKYYRDSSLTNNGVKMLDLTNSGTYCWLRRQNNLDSLYCYGSYVQTSDTSILWNNTDWVRIKITPIDTIQKGVKLEIFGSPIVPPLFGFANQ